MERAQLERDFDAVSVHLARAHDELSLVNDQLRALTEEVDSARLRSLLAETPSASTPLVRAHDHLETLNRARDAVQHTIDELESIRDALLNQLLAS